MGHFPPTASAGESLFSALKETEQKKALQIHHSQYF